jgi:hypothetical protein
MRLKIRSPVKNYPHTLANNIDQRSNTIINDLSYRRSPRLKDKECKILHNVKFCTKLTIFIELKKFFSSRKSK